MIMLFSKEEYARWAGIEPMVARPNSADPGKDLLELLASPNLASKSWISQQYDSQVGADTLQTGGDAGVVRVHGTKKATIAKTSAAKANREVKRRPRDPQKWTEIAANWR